MKKQVSMLSCLLVAFSTWGQVSFTAQVPPYGLVHRDQFWNIVIVSGQGQPLPLLVQLDVVNKATNQPVLSATSKLVHIMPGTHRLQLTELGPVSYSYYAAGSSIPREGLLPVGEYLACYTLRNPQQKEGVLAQDCLPVQVQFSGPPVLNQPADKSILSVPVPLFSWIPPTPVALLNNPTYDLVVVEWGQNQSPLNAVQQNLPVLSVKNLRDPFFSNPSGAQVLDTAKVYAWYVVVNNNGLPVAHTEVWSFRYKRETTVEKAPGKEAFYTLKSSPEAEYAVFSRQARLIYHNDTGDTLVSYTIKDMKALQGSVVAQGSIRVRPGQNFVEMPLKKFQADRLYVISFLNARRQEWSLKFVKSPDN